MSVCVVLAHGFTNRTSTPHVRAIAVSSLARWYCRDTVAMRRVLYAIEKAPGRLGARVFLRTRISARTWDPVPLSPVQCVDLVAVPLLLVHNPGPGGEAERLDEGHGGGAGTTTRRPRGLLPGSWA
ncbi:MAG: hydrolase [Frankiales bacterium]|nr:hydrolase [Frankiales bacterium]